MFDLRAVTKSTEVTGPVLFVTHYQGSLVIYFSIITLHLYHFISELLQNKSLASDGALCSSQSNKAEFSIDERHNNFIIIRLCHQHFNVNANQCN